MRLHHLRKLEPLLPLLLEDFYKRMAEDPLLAHFFFQKDPSTIAKHQVAFLRSAWGLSSAYQGPTIAQAHRHLPPLFAAHFNRRLILLKKTLEDHKLDSLAIQAWIQFEEGFRKVLVK
jgi:methyl-accepting chemotaxis protein